MKSTWKTYVLSAFYIVVGVSIFLILMETVKVKNTGFETKTLWDWMELLIIPLVLAIGVFFLNRSERAIERQTAKDRAELEREIAKDRQHEAALQAYLDHMSELLLKEKLRTTEIQEVRDLARTRTISILRGLDNKRSDLVIQFLREAKLIIDENSIMNGADMDGINLNGLDLKNTFLQKANLQEADLQWANLNGANLQSADLRWANLYDVNLKEANLQRVNLFSANLEKANSFAVNLEGADLTWASLQDANLKDANLKEASLEGASLQRVNLEGANLNGAILEGTNLEGASVTTDQLAVAKSLKDATMPDGTEQK